MERCIFRTKIAVKSMTHTKNDSSSIYRKELIAKKQFLKKILICDFP